MPSLADVPFDHLYNIGVRTLLFDHDNTLAPGLELTAGSQEILLLKRLKKRFRIVILSNNLFLRKKRSNFYKRMGIEYVKSFKPLVLERRLLNEAKAVLVGDRFTTDGLYAKIARIPCFLLDKRSIWFLKEWEKGSKKKKKIFF